jgi:glutamine synthetase type III
MRELLRAAIASASNDHRLGKWGYQQLFQYLLVLNFYIGSLMNLEKVKSENYLHMIKKTDLKLAGKTLWDIIRQYRPKQNFTLAHTGNKFGI